MPGVKPADLSPTALRRFRELAASSGRLEPGDLRASDAVLLDKLKLMEGDYLRRAAVLLFHEDPEHFVTGSFVKIGFFRSEADLVYHDLIQGNLFDQVARTVDLLRTKYLKAAIRYDGLQRIERFPVPYDALRETVLNALVHRDYAMTAPVQIRVYQDRLKFWNPAVLPEGWTLETLLGEHPSVPYNPDIANTFFRCGEIEIWGRGIRRIFDACRREGVPEPCIQLQGHDLWVEFRFAPDYLEAIAPSLPEQADQGGGRGEKWGEKWGEKIRARRLRIAQLMIANPRITTKELAAALDLSTSGVENHLKTMQDAGCLRRVGPAKGGHWELVE